MRRAWFVVVAILAVRPAAAEPLSPAGTKTFSGWTATCDNIGDCVAIATAPDDLFYVRIARDAGVTAPPVVKIVLPSPPLATEGSALAVVFHVATGGRPVSLGPFPVRSVDSYAGEVAASVPADGPSLAFIGAVLRGSSLAYTARGRKISLGLAGLSAALRWIDARQGRAGTPTALVSGGMTPIGQVPGPRGTPRVTAAPARSVADITTPAVSPALLRRAMALEDCDADTVTAHEHTEAWQVGPDQILVAVPCLRAAYNVTTALYFTDRTGEKPRPVPLPRAPDGDVATAENVVTNMRFDPQTMILSEFAKGRGVGDCGETRTFVWTGQIFALLEATALDACPGAYQEDWPRTYKAERE